MIASHPKIVIVAAEWHDFIVRKLIDGARETLERHDIPIDNVQVVRSPGSFEIPLVTKQVITALHPDAVICLGVVVKGDTAPFEYVCEPVAHALMDLSLQTGVPCLFGVLMTYTLEQAQERAGGTMGNKGAECAEAALSVLKTLRSLPSI